MKQSKRWIENQRAKAARREAGPPKVSKYAAKRRPTMVEGERPARGMVEGKAHE